MKVKTAEKKKEWKDGPNDGREWGIDKVELKGQNDVDLEGENTD